MKIAAMIPIKTNNERLKGKNTKEFFDGTPLIHFIQKALLMSSHIDDIYVFCSDERIKKYLLPNVVFLKRSKELDRDSATPQMIMDEFIDKIDADIYCISHATAPFTNPKKIDLCIEKVNNGEYSSAFIGCNLYSLLWKDGQPLNFNNSNIPRTQDLEKIYKEVSSCYIFKKDLYKKFKCRTYINPYICEASKIEAIDIDTMEDFIIANAVYKYQKETNGKKI